ncbi:hypothetical protein [Curtobacterium sp. DN_7.5]|uniref:hypothetical protein n=1 Tax=Curtobacterium sp. DN_7.5 TaxID=3049047 RepID=UPI001F55E4C7|nr:hypothetical protein [Curtobacterium sp. DN_7.5]
MTILGAVLALVLAGLVVTRRTAWLPIVLGVTAGLPYSAAVSVGGNSVPLFFVAGLLAVVLLLAPAPGALAPHWTRVVLVCFVAWSLLITVAAPWFFRGIRVLSSRGGVDLQVLDPDTLAFTASTAGQVAYVLIAVAVLLYLVRAGAALTTVTVAFAVGTVGTTLRGIMVVSSGDLLGPLMDTTNAIYADPGTRLRGVFNEPSELAAFSLPAAVFFAMMASTGVRRRRWPWWLLALTACANLLQAASGVAVVASGVVVSAGIVVLLVRSLVLGGVGVQWFVLGGLAAAFVLIGWWSELTAPIVELVDDKIGSQSWNARTGADVFSLQLIGQTGGLGVGLGGNRPSSFAVALPSTIGVPGTVLFLLLVVGAVLATRTDRGLLPASVSLVALLIAKSVGNPDLSTPVLWLLIGVCFVPLWRRALIHDAGPAAAASTAVSPATAARLLTRTES